MKQVRRKDSKNRVLEKGETASNNICNHVERVKGKRKPDLQFRGFIWSLMEQGQNDGQRTYGTAQETEKG